MRKIAFVKVSKNMVFRISPVNIVHLGIKYDAEKEAKQLMEARQRELQRIEEAKQKIAEQGKSENT